jgi:hypothetical protein
MVFADPWGIHLPLLDSQIAEFQDLPFNEATEFIATPDPNHAAAPHAESSRAVRLARLV